MTTTKTAGLDWERLVRSQMHPTKLRILTILASPGAEYSPSELAELFDEPLGNVSYHMRHLLQLQLVRLVRTEPRRGAVEHYYEATR